MRAARPTAAPDPWLARRVAEAVAQHEDVLLPEELAWVAEQILEIMVNDVDATMAMRAARPKRRVRPCR